MLKRIRDLPKVWKIARLWNRALDEASQGKYKDSLHSLKCIFSVLKAEMPSAQAPYDFNMLCGQLASNLGDYDMCVAATVIALRQLSGKAIRGLSEYDKDYLSYYCKGLLEYCAHKGKQVHVPDEILKADLAYASLRVEMVKRHLKMKFPISPPDPPSRSLLNGA